MAGRTKLNKRAVDALAPQGRRYDVWDASLAGFGLRVSPTGAKTFILRYRPKRWGAGAPKRFMTLGRYGPMTVAKARDRATAILGTVAEGHDPAGALAAELVSMTIADTVKEFMATHVEAKRKPATQAYYHYVFERHVIPAIGQRKLIHVSKADVAKLHGSMQAKPYMANRVMSAIGSLYNWATARGLAPEGLNPTKRLEKFRENRRERFLTSEELRRLGDALREAETRGIPWDVDETRPTAKHAPKSERRLTVVSPFVVAAIMGRRSNRIQSNLENSEVGFYRHT